MKDENLFVKDIKVFIQFLAYPVYFIFILSILIIPLYIVWYIMFKANNNLQVVSFGTFALLWFMFITSIIDIKKWFTKNE